MPENIGNGVVIKLNITKEYFQNVNLKFIISFVKGIILKVIYCVSFYPHLFNLKNIIIEVNLFFQIKIVT